MFEFKIYINNTLWVFWLVTKMTIVIFYYNCKLLSQKNHYVVAKAMETSCDVMVLQL